jgi:hypothetical protein
VKYALIKCGRGFDVQGRDVQVADLAVAQGRMFITHGLLGLYVISIIDKQFPSL